jgi:hypothetical protein
MDDGACDAERAEVTNFINGAASCEEVTDMDTAGSGAQQGGGGDRSGEGNALHLSNRPPFHIVHTNTR